MLVGTQDGQIEILFSIFSDKITKLHLSLSSVAGNAPDCADFAWR